MRAVLRKEKLFILSIALWLGLGAAWVDMASIAKSGSSLAPIFQVLYIVVYMAWWICFVAVVVTGIEAQTMFMRSDE